MTDIAYLFVTALYVNNGKNGLNSSLRFLNVSDMAIICMTFKFSRRSRFWSGFEILKENEINEINLFQPFQGYKNKIQHFLKL